MTDGRSHESRSTGGLCKPGRQGNRFSPRTPRRTQPCAHRDVSPAHLILASWPPEAEEDNFVVFRITELVYSVTAAVGNLCVLPRMCYRMERRDPVQEIFGIQYWQGLVPVGWGEERGRGLRVNRRSLTCVPERRTVLLTEIEGEAEGARRGEFGVC